MLEHSDIKIQMIRPKLLRMQVNSNKSRSNARVIYYASKSLTGTEKRYCQTEKEALALVWAVETFFINLFGKEFELVTDHKPLKAIRFKPISKPCTRIERWVLRLQSYRFKIKYIRGKYNIADPLSSLDFVYHQMIGLTMPSIMKHLFAM